MENPLAKYTNINVYDDTINEEIVISPINIGKYFKKVYFLCPLGDIDMISIKHLLNPIIDIDIFNNSISKMILYQSNISIVHTSIHYGNIIYCNTEHLHSANKFNYKLEKLELIIPIYNISFLSLQKYIDNINDINSFNKLYDIIILNNYFGEKKDKLSNILRINTIIRNMDETRYWMMPFNCQLNMTKLFNSRKFNMNTIDNSPIKENYIAQIFNSKKYVDPSMIINKKGYKLYSKVWSCIYTKDDIYKLFKTLNDEQQYLLFSNMCVSKPYCHLVFSIDILQLMKPVINRYIQLYRYLFGYSWIRFYFEECINRHRVKTTDMYIFDINTASNLPVFEYKPSVPNWNPYMPLIVSNDSLKPMHNIGSVTNYTTERRICNLEEFKQRMNIFISGNNSINLLDGIDFKALKIAISGSIMTACLQYKHPLIKLHNTNPEFNATYNRYFDEYYYDSDIDTMVMSENIFEFFDISIKFHEQILLNVCKYLGAEPSHIKYNVNPNSYLFVSSEFIKKHICTNMISYEAIIANLTKKPIICMFIPFAKKMHELNCKKLLEEYKSYNNLSEEIIVTKYPHIFTFNEESLVIKLHDTKTNSCMISKEIMEADFTQDDIEIMLSSENIKEEPIDIKIHMIEGLSYTNNFKIRIAGPHLTHDFEMFPIYKNDFMTTVANFHMPCVRAYYDGNNVYMTPSCISAHMTYMNIDYKYFAGSKDPISIINKYRMRGFGVFLNKDEIETYIKFCHSVPFWNNMFNINPLNKKSYNNCMGPLQINHHLFKPRAYNKELIVGEHIRPIPEAPLDYNSVQIAIVEWIYPESLHLDIDKLSTINSDTGYIEPLEHNIIDKVKHDINLIY